MPTNGPRPTNNDNESVDKYHQNLHDDETSQHMSGVDRKVSQEAFPDNLSNGQYRMGMQ